MFILSWLAYMSAYLCRTNIAIVLPDMVESLNFSKTEAGLIGTAFFWTYAVGQLINGNIGDRVNSKRFIFLGLISAAVLNMLVGFSSSYFIIVTLWACNGFFLSVLWGPLIRTLSYWFSNEKRTKIAAGISTSMIGGFLFTWGVVGQIIAFTHWRWAFWIPGIIVFCYSFIWLWKIKSRPEEVGLTSPNDLVDKVVQDENPVNILELIIEAKLWIIALACISLGIVREGILLWGPTYLNDIYDVSQSFVSAFSLFMPVLSLAGILGAGYINKRLDQKDESSIILLMSGTAVTFLVMNFIMDTNIFMDALLLGVGVACLFGANTLLLGVMPMNYADKNKVSGVAGFLDFATYIGAAIGGGLVGYVLDTFNWNLVIILWMFFAAAGVVSILSKWASESGQTSPWKRWRAE